jgi:hypothetical protein
MRTALLVVSGLLAAVFAVAFLATFFAKGHITRLAEDYVIDKTREHADPLVEILEWGIRVPGLKVLARDAELVRTVEREVTEYRRDPRAYVANVVAADPGPRPARPDPGAPLTDQVLFWKAEIRAHFEKTMDGLLLDLRIFFGSNFAVALLTAACAYWSRGRLVFWLLPVAILLLASLGFSIYLYVDNFSFFHILTGTYIGWGYPKFLAAIFLVLLVRLGRLVFGLTALAHRAAATR